jgi:hypothetical protein
MGPVVSQKSRSEAPLRLVEDLLNRLTGVDGLCEGFNEFADLVTVITPVGTARDHCSDFIAPRHRRRWRAAHPYPVSGRNAAHYVEDCGAVLLGLS